MEISEIIPSVQAWPFWVRLVLLLMVVFLGFIILFIPFTKKPSESASSPKRVPAENSLENLQPPTHQSASTSGSHSPIIQAAPHILNDFLETPAQPAQHFEGAEVMGDQMKGVLKSVQMGSHLRS